jgi:heme/copper-type cytochrome/quinol oxidase subunit 2
MVNDSTSKILVIAIVIAIIAVGVGTGLFAAYFMTSEVSGGIVHTKSGGEKVYSLVLVIVAGAHWNNTATAPRYYIMTTAGLDSSANITIPSNTLIKLTIINYDSSTPLPAQYAIVSGTVGNIVYLYNTTSTENLTNQNVERVSTMNATWEVSHTFTVTQLGLNIPVAGSSIEVANFYVNQTGNFNWQCEDPCGFGPTGWLGAMATPGWMTGNLIVT